jgi:LDH2 family malate/lactate/ureidoglycolate dehydrogenase
MIRLTAEEAGALAHNALIAAGATTSVAEAVSCHAVDAELAGHPSHGLRLIPNYCAEAGNPGNDLTAEPRITSARGPLTTIDARSGLGHLAMGMAVDCAAERAHEFGVGVTAVIQCGHAGRAGAWVERGTARGCVTMVVLGGSAPPFVMAAGPGAIPALQTNPLALGVPAPDHPLMLDMATSMVAEGKVRVALARHTMLPEGSILSVDGVLSSDPKDFVNGGCLLPVGGHKGFGLSAMVEALGISLTGADDAGRAPLEGALVMCLEAWAFRPIEDVMTSVEALRSRIRESGVQVGTVLSPGDPEAQRRLAAAGYLEIDDGVVERLRALSGSA